MDDGAVLLADRWVAADAQHEPAADRARALALRAPAVRSGCCSAACWPSAGWRLVIQSVRGTFGSGGRFSPFDERGDGLATLRWIRAQPWHAGPVGTLGPSYLGFVQWAVAGQPDADLAAMSVQVSASAVL